MNLCKYKNMFGEPNTGIHSYRIFNIAFIDVFSTMIFVYIICWFFELPYLPYLAFAFLLGIFAHRMFCVRTTVDKLLFP